MTRQRLIKLLISAAVFILTTSLVLEFFPFAAKANPTVGPDREPRPTQAGNAMIAAQCMECHHSELLSRVDQLTTDPSPDLRPAWSADGKRLAFYSSRSGNDDIFVVNVDGSDEAQLTQDPASDRRPTWSHDGSKIVFDSDRSGNRDIWIMNADGSDQRQLTATSSAEMFASFSPDGAQIFFYGYEDGRNDIWSMDSDGGNLKPLTSGLTDVKQNQCTFACHTPAVSPDGSTIVYDADQGGERNIWLMDSDGANPRQLTTTDRSPSDPTIITNNFLPSWTADGRIIFQAERPLALTLRNDIRVIDADGGNQTTLFTEVAHGGPFIWSPDGTRVALHSQRAGAGNFDIFVATFGEVAEEEVVADADVSQETEAPEAAQPELEASTPPVEASPGAVSAIAGPIVGLVVVAGLIGLAAAIFGFGRRSRPRRD
jgi:Tol biopolymer transport system component